MNKNEGVALLGKIKSMQWVQTPSPVSSLPQLAQELGLQGLYIKRDDMLAALSGGTKARKLDYLLATEPFEKAPGYHGVGALGSGLLVALSQACVKLGKTLHAHMFDEEIDGHVLDNLAITASVAQSVHYAKSRAKLAAKHAALFRKPVVAGLPVVPPGATNAAGMVGLVRAALELGEQIKAGALPEPARIYVPMGSGGTIAGLSVGLALARVPAKLHAVSAVEKSVSSEKRIGELQQQLMAWLTKEGISGTSSLRPYPVVIDRSQLGAGYGVSTDASREAVRRAFRTGIHLESIYTGKAFAALLADAKDIGKRPVLFWQTRRGAQPAVRGDWSTRLPEPLQWRLRSR